MSCSREHGVLKLTVFCGLLHIVGNRNGLWGVEEGQLAKKGFKAALFRLPVNLDAKPNEDYSSPTVRGIRKDDRTRINLT